MRDEIRRGLRKRGLVLLGAVAAAVGAFVSLSALGFPEWAATAAAFLSAWLVDELAYPR